jgi:hypothetical protein
MGRLAVAARKVSLGNSKVRADEGLHARSGQLERTDDMRRGLEEVAPRSEHNAASASIHAPGNADFGFGARIPRPIRTTRPTLKSVVRFHGYPPSSLETKRIPAMQRGVRDASEDRAASGSRERNRISPGRLPPWCSSSERGPGESAGLSKLMPSRSYRRFRQVFEASSRIGISFSTSARRVARRAAWHDCIVVQRRAP